MWNQVYNPFNNAVLSTIAAALPVVTLLVLIASNKVKAHIRRDYCADRCEFCRDCHLHDACRHVAARDCTRHRDRVLPDRLDRAQRYLSLPPDRGERAYSKRCRTRSAASPTTGGLQLLLIAFSFGAFFEGASGFGTPVAVTGAILIGLGFSPLAASGLSLIANTAPVAYGALGTPIAGSFQRHGHRSIPARRHGRPPTAVLFVDRAVLADLGLCRLAGMKDIWPAILVTGVSFAIPQFLISNFINPWIVDIGASLISMACLVLFLQVWQPKVTLDVAGAAQSRSHPQPIMPASEATRKPTIAQVWMSLLPWIIVCAILLLWGTNWFKGQVNPWATWNYAVPGSAQHDQQGCADRRDADQGRRGLLVHLALLYRLGHADCRDHLGLPHGLLARGPREAYGQTIKVCAYSLITISAMLGSAP